MMEDDGNQGKVVRDKIDTMETDNLNAMRSTLPAVLTQKSLKEKLHTSVRDLVHDA